MKVTTENLHDIYFSFFVTRRDAIVQFSCLLQRCWPTLSPWLWYQSKNIPWQNSISFQSSPWNWKFHLLAPKNQRASSISLKFPFWQEYKVDIYIKLYSTLEQVESMSSLIFQIVRVLWNSYYQRLNSEYIQYLFRFLLVLII